MRLLLTLFLSLAAAMSARADVSYIESSIEFEGRLLGQRFVEIGPAGAQSLCVALRLPGGRRELRIFAVSDRGLSSTPTHVVPVLEDVTAYGFADVREEPGNELVFLTRTGAWSYSLTRDGYRDNILRLAEDNLLYDVPDSRSLPYWPYLIPAANGDLVLLPGSEGYSIWGPRAKTDELEKGEATYEAWADFWARPVQLEESSDDSQGEGSATVGGGELRIELRGDGLFLGEDRDRSALLSDSKAYSAPALIDVNGDGALDLIAADDDKLHVHLSKAGRIPAEPTRVEEFPDYLQSEDADISFDFADLDGDGRQDLIAIVEEDVEGFENGEKRLLFLVNDGQRLLPVKPRQVMRFEAALVLWDVVDVNRDGLPDLLLRQYELPSLLETVTGLEFRMTNLGYLATDGGSTLFERRPVLKQTQVFNENTVGDAIKSRMFDFDCSGDGIPDLVEIDLQGRIVIRRLTHDSGFFSGDTWTLEEKPWKSFETRGTILAVRVLDVNNDGVGDILSPSEGSLTLHLSRKRD